MTDPRYRYAPLPRGGFGVFRGDALVSTTANATWALRISELFNSVASYSEEASELLRDHDGLWADPDLCDGPLHDFLRRIAAALNEMEERNDAGS